MQKPNLEKAILKFQRSGSGCMGMSWSYGPPKDKQRDDSLLTPRGAEVSRSSILPRYTALLNEDW